MFHSRPFKGGQGGDSFMSDTCIWPNFKRTTLSSPSGLPILEKRRVYFMVGDPQALKPQKSPSKSIVSLPHTPLLFISHLGLCQVSNGDRHTF